MNTKIADHSITSRPRPKKSLFEIYKNEKKESKEISKKKGEKRQVKLPLPELSKDSISENTLSEQKGNQQIELDSIEHKGKLFFIILKIWYR